MDNVGAQWQRLVEAGYDTPRQPENDVVGDQTVSANVEWISDLLDSYVDEYRSTISEKSNSRVKRLAGDENAPRKSLRKRHDNDNDAIADPTGQSPPEFVGRQIDSHVCRGFLDRLTTMRRSASVTGNDDHKLDRRETDGTDVEAACTSFARDDVKRSSIMIVRPDNNDDHTKQFKVDENRSAEHSNQKIFSRKEDFTDKINGNGLSDEYKEPSVVLINNMAENENLKNIKNLAKKPKKFLLKWFSLRRLWSKRDKVEFRENDNEFDMPRTKVKHIQIKFKKV